MSSPIDSIGELVLTFLVNHIPDYIIGNDNRGNKAKKCTSDRVSSEIPLAQELDMRASNFFPDIPVSSHEITGVHRFFPGRLHHVQPEQAASRAHDEAVVLQHDLARLTGARRRRSAFSTLTMLPSRNVYAPGPGREPAHAVLDLLVPGASSR